jgi:uncharacterized membrane protein
MTESLSVHDSLSVYGFPDRAPRYHSVWVARLFTFWGAVSYVTGGFLTVPVLDQATKSSVTPQRIEPLRVNSTPFYLLGSWLEIAILVIGFALLLIGMLIWILNPEWSREDWRHQDYREGSTIGFRLYRAIEPERALGAGLVMVFLAAMLPELAIGEFIRYLGGLGVFTLLSCVVVGAAYMAAGPGRSTFPSIARVMYAYLVAALLTVWALFAVIHGPWISNLLLGLALPGPGLLVLGLHLCHHVHKDQADRRLQEVQAYRQWEDQRADKRMQHEREQAIWQREERKREREAEETRRNQESSAERELLEYLRVSR